MADFARAKRVTDPLDDKVKARLVGMDRPEQLSYVSSGSEHSPCLSDLVHSFLEEDDCENQSPDSDSDSDRVESVTECTSIESILRPTVCNNAEFYYKNLLLDHVVDSMELCSCFGSVKSVFRRKVMAILRDLGHNAAICKTNWIATTGGITAGNYEFIDVIRTSASNLNRRYFIDLDFAGEFEIARPTNQYSRLVESIPRVFVGKSEELKRIVRAMCNAAKRSLKSRELTVPPWRKNIYMQNKWFGSYRRTTNSVPSGSVTVLDGKCRFVGFDDTANGRLLVRTR